MLSSILICHTQLTVSGRFIVLLPQKAGVVPQLKRNKQIFLMTCQARIFGPDGNFTQARVFLGIRSCLLVIVERLAQQLRLPRRRNNTMIVGINAMSARGAVSFTMGHVHGGGKKICVEDAFVLTRVTTDTLHASQSR